MSSFGESDKKLAFLIGEYLNSFVKNDKISEDVSESLSVAVQCITDAFGFDLNDLEDRNRLRVYNSSSLADIFRLYLKSADKTSVQSVSEDKLKEAEELKAKGNKFLLEKEFEKAIELYSQAIEINPRSAVYLSNRAAAFSQLGKHQNAVDDCKSAIDIDPSYAKAYSRLGLAYYSLEEYQNALEAYESSLKIDPDNNTAKKQLDMVKGKLDITKKPPSSSEGSTSNAGQGPGGFDLSSLMSNPAIMGMAQKMMSDPSMAQSLQGLMGDRSGQESSSGNPLSGLLNNPNLMNMAQNMMQDPQMAELAKNFTKNPPKK